MGALIKALPQHRFLPCVVNARSKPEKEVDVILVQNVPLMGRVWIGDRRKVVLRLGGNRTFYPDGSNYQDIMRDVFAIIATNSRLFEIGKRSNNNVHLIPNGLNLDEWAPVAPPEKFKVGFCGNISRPEYAEYKGFNLLAAVCERGGYFLKSALYGTDQIQHNRMREDFYGQISVLVQPTDGEGCSNTIMEALACGVPVITTREAGYHGERLEDGVNVLFCDRTVESITEKINLVKSPEVREKLSKNGRRFAEKHHDISSVAGKYDAIFGACYLSRQGGGMLIRYTGPKPSKMLVLNGKQYFFRPTCMVDDPEAVDFLLNPARLGLFVQEGAAVPKVEVKPAAPVKPAPVAPAAPVPPVADSTAESAEFVCGECGFKAKSKMALYAHARRHKK